MSPAFAFVECCGDEFDDFSSADAGPMGLFAPPRQQPQQPAGFLLSFSFGGDAGAPAPPMREALYLDERERNFFDFDDSRLELGVRVERLEQVLHLGLALALAAWRAVGPDTTWTCDTCVDS